MGPRNLPQEQPQQLFDDASQDVQVQKAQAELEATVLRFWDTVRKSADVIVTLRQENAILQSQAQSLRKSETELQSRVEDFLVRIESLETLPKPLPQPPSQAASRKADAHDALHVNALAQEALIVKAHEAEVRGLRTNIDRLEDELNRLQNELNEAQAQLGDHKAISQQLAQVRTELETRTNLLQEMQATLEENRNKRQLDIFSVAARPGMVPADMLALASRLDALSGRISSLFGIS